MPVARILRPAKTAMSSGRANSKQWIFEYETASKRQPDPLMGWTSASDTLNEIRLKFDTLEEATAYAVSKGIEYSVEEPHSRSIKPKAYADNFKFDRVPR